jgi:hypothetical protein
MTMTSRIFKILTILAVTALAAGCKLVIVSPPGGDVTSLSSGTCAGGSVCEVEITNPAFTDTFTAVPKPGYAFVRWQGGNDDFKCGNSTNTTCTITFTGDIYHQVATSSYEIINIMPIYKDVGFDTDGDGDFDRKDPDDDDDGVEDGLDNCPLVGPNLDGFGCPYVPDYAVYVNGRLWYQPIWFDGVTRQDILNVCPDGECVGVLNGVELTGWTWARRSDVDQLFESMDPPLNQPCEVYEGMKATGFLMYDITEIPVILPDLTALGVGGYVYDGSYALAKRANPPYTWMCYISSQDTDGSPNAQHGSGWFYRQF